MTRADRGDEGGRLLRTARVLRAVPATAPYQDPVSGAATTDGLIAVSFRDRP